MSTIEDRPSGAVERIWSHHAQVTLLPKKRPVITESLPGGHRRLTLTVESITLHTTVLDGMVQRLVVAIAVDRVPHRSGQAQEGITYSDNSPGEYTKPMDALPPQVAAILADEPTWLDRLTTTERKH